MMCQNLEKLKKNQSVKSEWTIPETFSKGGIYLNRDESGKGPVIKMNDILIVHFRNKNDSYSIAHDLWVTNYNSLYQFLPGIIQVSADTGSKESNMIFNSP